MDASTMVKVIKENGYAVFPEWDAFRGRWEILIAPWDHEKGRKRPGNVRHTEHYFGKNECVMSPGNETEFEKKMKEVQQKLAEHFLKKNKEKAI